jgi:hypothetical protein
MASCCAAYTISNQFGCSNSSNDSELDDFLKNSCESLPCGPSSNIACIVPASGVGTGGMVCALKKRCTDTLPFTPTSSNNPGPRADSTYSGLTSSSSDLDSTSTESTSPISSVTDITTDNQQASTSNVLTYSAGGAAAGLFVLATAGVGFLYRRRYSAADLEDEAAAPTVTVNPLYEGKSNAGLINVNLIDVLLVGVLSIFENPLFNDDSLVSPFTFSTSSNPT